MATATKVVLKPELGAQFAVEDLSEEAAKRTSELLQENNRKHHIFFNKEGFHSTCSISYPCQIRIRSFDSHLCEDHSFLDE